MTSSPAGSPIPTAAGEVIEKAFWGFPAYRRRQLTAAVLDVLAAAGMGIVGIDFHNHWLGVVADIRKDITQAVADGDNERRSYFRGEMRGVSSVLDQLPGAASLPTTNKESGND